MDASLVTLIISGVIQIIVALIAGWAAIASRRAERAANHGNKKIAELQEQLLKMNERVRKTKGKR